MIPDWPPAARTCPSERKVPEYACKNYSKSSSVEKRIVETHTNSTFPLAPQTLETRTQPQIEISASNGNREICCKWIRFLIFKYMIGLGKTYHIVETCYPLLHLTSLTIVNDDLRKPKTGSETSSHNLFHFFLFLNQFSRHSTLNCLHAPHYNMLSITHFLNKEEHEIATNA